MDYVSGPASFSQVFFIGLAVVVFVVGAAVILVRASRSGRRGR